MRALVLVVGMTACGRIHFDAEQDAALVPDAVGDEDHDGVPDNVDNCPTVYNPDQANEDGDRFGDVCDPCPPYPDADPVVDTDHDGVSDACDPNPTVPGDKIAVFEGFVEPPPTAQLFGTWTFSDGNAYAPSGLNVSSAMTWQLPAGTSETVTAFVTADEFFGSNTPRPIGVVHFYDNADNTNVLCVFGITSFETEVFAIVANTTSIIVDETAPVATGTATTVASERVGSSYGCTGQDAPMQLTTTYAGSSTPNNVGLFTLNAATHYAWAMIVTSP
jgi:hypothetical protein